jgi:hypothetical protein
VHADKLADTKEETLEEDEGVEVEVVVEEDDVVEEEVEEKCQLLTLHSSSTQTQLR